ncbi:response regulator [Cytophagaceae bacterium ABcell3]|nr:response regulator [Cytophagaceae bacterium ABcell3]
MKKLNCVMLIDDDGVTNFINHRLINRLDVADSIETVINGDEAWQFLQHYTSKNNQNCPELILLDLNMPVMDGFEFLNLFKSFECNNKSQAKVVILTTSTHQKDIKAIVKDKSVGYITKPLTKEKLQPYINEIVKNLKALA